MLARSADTEERVRSTLAELVQPRAGTEAAMDFSMRAVGDWQPRALNPRTLADHPLAYVIGDLTDDARNELRR
jgi:hypothetical protein